MQTNITKRGVALKFKESSNVELKSIVNNDFKKEVIAFANTNGGEIYVGVDDDGTVIGVENIDDEMEKIGAIIRNGIKPDLTQYTSIEEQVINDKSIIKVTVMRGQKRPYHVSDKGLKTSAVFVRHGVSSVPVTEDTIRTMLKETDGVTFDKSRCLNQDLTFSYAREIFKKQNVAFEESNMKTLGLIDNDGYYTNAALLLSDQCEHSIKCAIYEDTTKMEFKARKEFYGSVLKQIDEAFEYINLSNNQNSTFEGLIRVEHYDYPQYAIREALLNAVVHRDYDYSGSILINIFSNRIEFVSIGGLVKGITFDDVMAGISQPRNALIANVFYRLRLIESYGTGIQRILESYQDQVSKPIFKIAAASFVVVLPKRDSFDGSLSDEDVVINLVKDKSFITRNDIQIVLNCSKFKAINILNMLMERNIIRKSGTGRNTKYTIV